MAFSVQALPNFIVLLNDHVLIAGLVTRRVRVRIELHVSRDGVAGDKTRQGTDLGEKTDFVNLSQCICILRVLLPNKVV